jgi:hypothetical protein
MTAATILTQRVDEFAILQPTRIFYIRSLSGKDHSDALDLTPFLGSSCTSDIDSAFLDSAQHAINANPILQPAWRLTRGSRFSTSRITVTDAATSSEVAKWHSPILGFGAAHIVFPTNSPHCSHKLDLKPLKVEDRAQGFVKDSVSYAWQLTGKPVSRTDPRGALSLYKTGPGGAGARKIEVARYRSMSGKFEVGGVLVLEEREVDALVAVLTLLAVLNQRDSFYAPGMGGRADLQSGALTFG